MGKLCNQACHPSHIDAGTARTEMMDERVVNRIIELMKRNPLAQTIDIIGGALELNPYFPWLVAESKEVGRHIIDCCNLTVFFRAWASRLRALLVRA
jgi:hypothetical protein